MPTETQRVQLDPQSEIFLDPYNPRLRLEEEGSDQDGLLRIMAERFKVHELGESIVSAGYLPVDPLLGYRRGERVFVREGNRRIAAIKLLMNPELAPERHQNRWMQLNGRLTDETRAALQQVEITVYGDRDDPELRSYIGYRHVTGVLQWPALEKAGFIAELIDSGWGYAEVAERLGSYPAHVRRHLLAFRITRQAVENEMPGSSQMEGAFGVLLRALQAGGIADFLGLRLTPDLDVAPNPVPPDHMENFEQFVLWTFGTEDVPRVLPDSRRLTDWGKILQSPEAVRYLRTAPHPDFDRAWLKAGGQADSLADALWTASYRLEESVPLVILHRDNEEVAEAAKRCIVFMDQIAQYFPSASPT